jgi:ATP-dependent exoDNAse (exonuclease V) beta subunit
MTTHRAKGLEFPVVVLADITAKQTGQASRFIDSSRELCALRIAGWSPADLHDHEEEETRRDEAEGLRVAYVAATRARDLLVVPVVGDEPFTSGWVSCLNDALYGPRPGWRTAEPAPGCPAFGADATLDRPAEVAFEVSGVKPGMHRFEQAGYGVVWWDPRLLGLDAQPRFGIRQQELIGKETKDEIVQADLNVYRTWRDRRASALANGARASLRVATATEQGQGTSAAGVAVDIIELNADRNRPAGPRFGALVHAVLAVVALDAQPDRIATVTAAQARILGATGEEADAAAALVTAALPHPLMRRAHAAAAHGKCRRETPITLRAADGTLVEGVVDLAFCEDDVWTVVDFKTDRELEKGVDAYRRQVGLYAEAIQTATGQPAKALLFRL